MLRRVHGQVVILAFVRKSGIIGRPPVVTVAPQHSSHAYRDIVIQEETHDTPGLNPRPRTAGQPRYRPESATGIPG